MFSQNYSQNLPGILALSLPLLLIIGLNLRKRSIRPDLRPQQQQRRRQQQQQQQQTELEEEDVFEVFVSPSDRFKFNAAHFIAYKGFRERLHGHNYSVAITLIGKGLLGNDGYLIDFGDVKDIVGSLCKKLNEHFILPMYSEALTITLDELNCHILCEDGTWFNIPRDDVIELPIAHSSAEEIARYLWGQIVNAFGLERLESRNVVALQVVVAEMPNQQATFRRYLKDANKSVNDYINVPQGCYHNLASSS